MLRACGVRPDSVDPALVRVFAPTGRLQASIDLGNPILANRDPGSGLPVGVSVDLAGTLATRIGVAPELVVFDAAGRSVDAVTQEQADIGFFAIDPVRGAGIAFTNPYVLIEGAYLLRDDSPIRSNDEVDRDGRRIVVGQGSAHDLFLTRELKPAQLLRAPTSPASPIPSCASAPMSRRACVSNSKPDARRVAGLRVLDGRFMVIEQAMGLPKSRGALAAEFHTRFVEDVKASGFVARSLVRQPIEGAAVAPAGRGVQVRRSRRPSRRP